MNETVLYTAMGTAITGCVSAIVYLFHRLERKTDEAMQKSAEDSATNAARLDECDDDRRRLQRTCDRLQRTCDRLETEIERIKRGCHHVDCPFLKGK